MKKYLHALLNTRMLIVLLMGFASGLPLALTGQTLKAWATDAGLDLISIGYMSAFGIPYTYKVLVAPFVDRFIPPFLGRRRGWLLLMQVGLIATIFGLSEINPATSFTLLSILGFSVASLSAVQDIVIDAYRREFLHEEEFGFGNSLAITGYRLAMMFSTAFALILADHVAWSTVYKIMSAGMLLGLVTTLLAPEPKIEHSAPRTIVESFWGPLKEFFSRNGALWILAFIFFYKFGDQMASEMTTTFYLKIGFTKTDIAAVVKIFGIWSVILGGLVGGTLILRMGLYKSLWFFGVLQAISTFGFAYLAHVGPSLTVLMGVISFENFTAGMGTAAYTAFMASMTNKRYTATQYSLFTSLMGLPRSLAGMFTGWMVVSMGWQMFFTVCAFAAIPGMILLLKMKNLTSHQTIEN